MEQQTDSGRFEFYLVPQGLKTLESKDTHDLFFKWGMADNVQSKKFRFNWSFNIFSTQDFLLDFFNSPEVRSEVKFLGGVSPRVEKVEFEKLSTNVINMGFFDVLHEKDITTE